ncbi:MAG: hypothetical protein M3P26_17315, partial [Gemmatimonadota bacterium]|nr:hypothetical protein [Gemmatimonadota bacterium]
TFRFSEPISLKQRSSRLQDQAEVGISSVERTGIEPATSWLQTNTHQQPITVILPDFRGQPSVGAG